MLRGLERKGDSKNWTINYEVWLEVSSKYLIYLIYLIVFNIVIKIAQFVSKSKKSN